MDHGGRADREITSQQEVHLAAAGAGRVARWRGGRRHGEGQAVGTLSKEPALLCGECIPRPVACIEVPQNKGLATGKSSKVEEELPGFKDGARGCKYVPTMVSPRAIPATSRKWGVDIVDVTIKSKSFVLIQTPPLCLFAAVDR